MLMKPEKQTRQTRRKKRSLKTYSYHPRCQANTNGGPTPRPTVCLFVFFFICLFVCLFVCFFVVFVQPICLPAVNHQLQFILNLQRCEAGSVMCSKLGKFVGCAIRNLRNTQTHKYKNTKRQIQIQKYKRDVRLDQSCAADNLLVVQSPPSAIEVFSVIDP